MKAVIYIGYRTHDSSGDSLGAASPQLVFGFSKKGKNLETAQRSIKHCGPLLSSKGHYWHDEKGFDFFDGWLDTCLEYCETYAKEASKYMKKERVKEYDLINGKRIRHTNLETVSCEKLPIKAEEFFKKTLEKLLGEKK